MFTLILLVILGLGIAFFAIQNTVPVSINLAGTNVQGIPLYAIMLVSLLAGLVVGWVLSLFDWVSSAMTLRGKDMRLHDAQRTIDRLRERVTMLEHSGVKGGYVERSYRDEDSVNRRDNLFQRIGRRFRSRDRIER